MDRRHHNDNIKTQQGQRSDNSSQAEHGVQKEKRKRKKRSSCQRKMGSAICHRVNIGIGFTTTVRMLVILHCPLGQLALVAGAVLNRIRSIG
jgi:hypothetical protein